MNVADTETDQLKGATAAAISRCSMCCRVWPGIYKMTIARFIVFAKPNYPLDLPI